MAHRIAQTFLDNAIDRDVDQGAKASRVRRKAYFKVDPRMAPLPELDHAHDGCSQTEVGQDTRAQAAEHCPDLPLYVGDGVQGRAGLPGDLGTAPLIGKPRDAGKVDVDGKKKRTDLIVQIPRDFAPFLFL